MFQSRVENYVQSAFSDGGRPNVDCAVGDPPSLLLRSIIPMNVNGA